MDEEEKIKEEDYLYNYKRALSQPRWFQRLTDYFSFRNPIRWAVVVYAAIIWLLSFLVLSVVGNNFLGVYRFLLGVIPAYFGSQFFADWRPDGKFLPLFLWDYVKFVVFIASKGGTFYKDVKVEEKEKEEQFEI